MLKLVLKVLVSHAHAPRSGSHRVERNRDVMRDAWRDVLVRSPVDILLVLMSMTVLCTKTLDVFDELQVH